MSSIYQQNSDWPTSGYHLCDQGISLDASFDSVPQVLFFLIYALNVHAFAKILISFAQVRHSLQYEAIWRELTCQSRTTTFPVREQAGHSLKSALRHIIHFDNRDSSVFSTRGTLFRMVQEVTGLGGDVGFIKHEVNYQLNLPVTADVVSFVILLILQGFCN